MQTKTLLVAWVILTAITLTSLCSVRCGYTSSLFPSYISLISVLHQSKLSKNITTGKVSLLQEAEGIRCNDFVIQSYSPFCFPFILWLISLMCLWSYSCWNGINSINITPVETATRYLEEKIVSLHINVNWQIQLYLFQLKGWAIFCSLGCIYCVLIVVLIQDRSINHGIVLYFDNLFCEK